MYSLVVRKGVINIGTIENLKEVAYGKNIFE